MGLCLFKLANTGVKSVDLAEGFDMLFILFGDLDLVLKGEDRRFKLQLQREDVVFCLAHVLEFVDVVLREDNLFVVTSTEIPGHDAEAC
jgi:hypothetical protein